MNYYLDAFKKFAVFSGRARRVEFWMFALINILISIAIAALENILGIAQGGQGVLSTIYSLVVLIPSLAIGTRRLHDTGRSGWWLLLSLVPIVGAIVLIIFLAGDSQPGANKFGPNPKETA